MTSGLSPVAYKLGSIFENLDCTCRFPKMSNDSRLHDGPDLACTAVEEQICALISLLPSLLFPTLARMARDFLAIPATSVSVEWTFSKS